MKAEQYLQHIKHGGFKSFLKKALELGVKAEFIHGESAPLLKLEHGGKILFCYKRNLPVYKRMGNLTKNKEMTKTVLSASGICTPRGFVAASLAEALRLVKSKKLQYPLICKPVDGSLAKGVTWDIASSEELRAAIFHAKNAYGKKRPRSQFLIEEMFVANEYRVLVFNGKVLSCVQKISAGITGDGRSTIEELITSFNKKRSPGFEIRLDKIAKDTLKKHLLTMKTVLAKNRFFKLRNNLNMSDGGRAVESTQKMHPYFKDICVRAIDAVGLTYGGIDFFAQDITSSESKYVIIEINPNPFYNMHEKPLVEGKGVDVSSAILKSIFPKLSLR